jgi:hypothetical protein
MIMKKTFLILTAAAVLALRSFAAVQPAEKLLPDDTLAVLAIPDFTKALQIYHDSPQGQLWRDPAVKAFKDKFVNKLKDEFITPMEKDLGIKLDDYKTLPQGQLTFAVTQSEWSGTDKNGKEPALVMILDTKDKSSQLKSNLTYLRKKWVDAGKTVKTEKIRAVEFSVITLSSNDIPKALKGATKSEADQPAGDDKKDAVKPAPDTTLYVGQSDSLLLMANSPKVLEKILAAAGGGSVKTLSEVPSFDANNNSMFRDAPLYGWVNTKALLELLSHQESGPDPLTPAKIIAATGFGGLKSIAFAYRFSTDGEAFNLMLSVPEDSRTGLFKILAGEPKESSPPPFVPADVAKFQRWRLDGQKAWATLRKVVGDLSPESLGGVDFMLNSVEANAKEKDPDFDIKKNLFGNLGDDFITYQKAPKGESLQELNSAPALYLVGSPNPEKLAGALNSLMALLGQSSQPKEREFLGRKIYSIPFPSLPMAAGPSGGAPASLSYCSSGGYLAVSMDSGILEEYLRSSDTPAKSLREQAGLGDATQKISGPGTSLFGYSNDTETMRALIKVLKKEAASATGTDSFSMVAMAAGINADKMKDWLDFSLLPEFDQVSKYFSFSVYSGAATPEGIVFKAFAPLPPQLKK